jgi:vacuolar-type H+-ATPase subunit E/Vma4
MSEQIVVSHIIDTILQSANRKEADIVTKAKAQQQEILQRTEAKAKEEAQLMVHARCEEIRVQTGQQICAAENQARASLFRRREAIRLEIFEKAKEQIVAFTKSDAYLDFLIASAEKIHRAMNGNCAVLNLREADRPFAAQISARLGHSITLHIDPTILLGGIAVISTDGTLSIDDTLDCRLQQQENWFMENSGLVIE